MTEGRTMRTTAGEGFAELWRYPGPRLTTTRTVLTLALAFFFA
jgi:hypothetical protein